MACPAIITGDRFLLRTLEHIDCQAQLLGSYGYQALGQPGSSAALAMSALLTLFVALFGIRLLFGPGPGARDLVFDVLKIGIVLTLAFSWPAFRTVVHDLVLKGPAEIAVSISSPGLPDTGSGFAGQLQEVDDGILRLTAAGTGRRIGAYIDDQAPGGTFAGTALEDEKTYGRARLVWLAGVIGSLALLRLVAGLLLALAPLAAGLLLFEPTRGIFAGWLRGLVLAMIGSVGATIVLAAELAVLGPWLTDALGVRALGYAIPSAPTELFALCLAFALVQFAMIWLLAKVAFHRGWPNLPILAVSERAPALTASPLAAAGGPPVVNENRAQRISDSVERQLRREQGIDHPRLSYRSVAARGSGGAAASGDFVGTGIPAAERLGSSYRRTSARSSVAATRRDKGA